MVSSWSYQFPICQSVLAITVHGRWQPDLINTKESRLPVCDKPYHTNKRIVQKGRRLKFCRTVHKKVQPVCPWLLHAAREFYGSIGIYCTKTGLLISNRIICQPWGYCFVLLCAHDLGLHVVGKSQKTKTCLQRSCSDGTLRQFGWFFLCPRHSKNGGGALSVTPVRACVRPCVRPSVRYQNLVSAQ